MGVAYSNVIASARDSKVLPLCGEVEQAMTVPLGPLGMSIVRKHCLVKGEAQFANSKPKV